jgi:hypothetical protein
MAEFEAAYQKKVVPLLKTHGWVESAERQRAMPDSVFSKLFEFETLTVMREKFEAFWRDSAALEVGRSLGTTFGTSNEKGIIRVHLGLYSTPAGQTP